MTELNNTQRRKPARILAAALALAMSATAIPSTAFAASGDYDFQREQQRKNRHQAERNQNQRNQGQREQSRKHRNDDHDYRGGNRNAKRHDSHRRDRNRHARGDYYRGHRRHHGHNDDDVGSAIAGAIFGLAIGSIIADGYNESRYAPPSRTYYGPAEADYYDGPPAVEYAPEPFSDDWYAYCASKYDTFDPQTGTFQPYEGPRKLCK